MGGASASGGGVRGWRGEGGEDTSGMPLMELVFLTFRRVIFLIFKELLVLKRCSPNIFDQSNMKNQNHFPLYQTHSRRKLVIHKNGNHRISYTQIWNLSSPVFT